jgi:hypothetical protein
MLSEKAVRGVQAPQAYRSCPSVWGKLLPHAACRLAPLPHAARWQRTPVNYNVILYALSFSVLFNFLGVSDKGVIRPTLTGDSCDSSWLPRVPCRALSTHKPHLLNHCSVSSLAPSAKPRCSHRFLLLPWRPSQRSQQCCACLLGPVHPHLRPGSSTPLRSPSQTAGKQQFPHNAGPSKFVSLAAAPHGTTIIFARLLDKNVYRLFLYRSYRTIGGCRRVCRACTTGTHNSCSTQHPQQRLHSSRMNTHSSASCHHTHHINPYQQPSAHLAHRTVHACRCAFVGQRTVRAAYGSSSQLPAAAAYPPDTSAYLAHRTFHVCRALIHPFTPLISIIPPPSIHKPAKRATCVLRDVCTAVLQASF